MDYLFSENNVLRVFVNEVLRGVNERFIWDIM